MLDSDCAAMNQGVLMVSQAISRVHTTELDVKVKGWKERQKYLNVVVVDRNVGCSPVDMAPMFVTIHIAPARYPLFDERKRQE
jgi:hypothetical protein